MIGIATTPERRAAASEFFELFKTEWEFLRNGGKYDLVICCGAIPTDFHARLVLVYSPGELAFDQKHQLKVRQQESTEVAVYRGWRLPIFSGFASVSSSENKDDSATEKPKSSLFAKIESDGQVFIRIGYDLFAEVNHLLRNGQPSEFARIPSLEIHITILRDILLEHGIPFEEIPPIPAGYNFIVCLTHDVDHFAIRNHRCDHTMSGFLYRASIGSVIELFRGRKSIYQVGCNWLAVLSLPLVYLGIVPDFWSKLERYLELDHASTFFIIPKSREPGLTSTGEQVPRRAVAYDLSQLRDSISQIQAHRGEIAVHGIDAWRDVKKGREEREKIEVLNCSTEIGIRMHWLFFDAASPAKLDEAGFAYDSTFGYNETVGYRAGTTQAFRPVGAKHLLELPLHIMDTALFYPSHLYLSPQDAIIRISGMIDDMKQFGGVLMVNWHDRSIAPERLWNGVYVELVAKLEAAGAWFCTAGNAAKWFRRRREVTFQNGLDRHALSALEGDLPGLRIRSYQTDGLAPARGEDDGSIDSRLSRQPTGSTKQIAPAI